MSDIAPVRKLQDEAYDYLKECILSGELVPDELYSETRMTKLLNMSRTPVRDALLRLNMEGYIEIFPSRGFAIKKVSTSEIRETLEIRCALEGYATYVLAEQMDSAAAREVIFKLNECISEQDQILGMHNPDIVRFVDLNFLFHNIMIDFLQNETITQTYRKLESTIKEMTYRRLRRHPEVMSLISKAHLQIVALVRSGNKEQAYTRAKWHNDRDFYDDDFKDATL